MTATIDAREQRLIAIDKLQAAKHAANAALDSGMAALAATAAANAEKIAELIPVAKSLAQAAYPDGVTVSDLRVEAERRHILSGNEKGRELSYLGAVMKRAGLVNTGETRRSELESTHGIRQVVWRAATPHSAEPHGESTT